MQSSSENGVWNFISVTTRHTLKGRCFLRQNSLSLHSSQCSLLCNSCLAYKCCPDTESFHSRNRMMNPSDLLNFFFVICKLKIELLLSLTHSMSLSPFNLVSFSLCQYILKYSNHNYATVETLDIAFFFLLLLLCSVYSLNSHIHLFPTAFWS